MITIGIPVIITQKLFLTDQLLGVTQGLLAVGGILGGLLTVLLEKKLRPQKAHIPLFLCAACTCLMGVGIAAIDTPLTKYIILSVTGLAITIFSTMFSIQMLSVVQAETPQHLVGKVVACVMTFIMCVQPIGQLLYGILFERFTNPSILIIGVGAISLTIAMYSKKVLAKLGGSSKHDENSGRGSELNEGV